MTQDTSNTYCSRILFPNGQHLLPVKYSSYRLHMVLWISFCYVSCPKKNCHAAFRTSHALLSSHAQAITHTATRRDATPRATPPGPIRPLLPLEARQAPAQRFGPGPGPTSPTSPVTSRCGGGCGGFWEDLCKV